MRRSQRILALQQFSDLSPWIIDQPQHNLMTIEEEKITKEKQKKSKKKQANKRGQSLRIINGADKYNSRFQQSLIKHQKSSLKLVEYELPPLFARRDVALRKNATIFHKIATSVENKQSNKNSIDQNIEKIGGISLGTKLSKNRSHKKLTQYSVSTFVAEKKLSKFKLNGKQYLPEERINNQKTNRWLDNDLSTNLYDYGDIKHIPANTIMIHKDKDDVLKKVLGQLQCKIK